MDPTTLALAPPPQGGGHPLPTPRKPATMAARAMAVAVRGGGAHRRAGLRARKTAHGGSMAETRPAAFRAPGNRKPKPRAVGSTGSGVGEL